MGGGLGLGWLCADVSLLRGWFRGFGGVWWERRRRALVGTPTIDVHEFCSCLPRAFMMMKSTAGTRKC